MTKQPTARNYRPYMKMPNAPVKHIDINDPTQLDVAVQAEERANHATNIVKKQHRRRDKNLQREGYKLHGTVTGRLTHLMPEEQSSHLEPLQPSYYVIRKYKHEQKWISGHYSKDEAQNKLQRLQMTFQEDEFEVINELETPNYYNRTTYQPYLYMDPRGVTQ